MINKHEIYDDILNWVCISGTRIEKVKTLEERFYSERKTDIMLYGEHYAMVKMIEALDIKTPYLDQIIIYIGKKWGLLPILATRSKEKGWCGNFDSFIASKYLKLIKISKIKVHKYFS